MGCRIVVASLLAASALALAGPAGAYVTWPELDQLASTAAMRPVHVYCPSSQEEWAADPFAAGTLGYVVGPGSADGTYVAPAVCEGALAVAHDDPVVPAWKRALGVHVIVHESYHLRDWPLDGNEGAVECRAIRHFKTAVRLLGGTLDDAETLWPYALAFHYRLTRDAPAYKAKHCDEPWFY